mmetsp:Transcript_30150/g.83194  ORF Transcript_30150/g.83194 Transcript_30150/m.83194 type:complete len:206 (+) Transcript_30150:165-782(+)
MSSECSPNLDRWLQPSIRNHRLDGRRSGRARWQARARPRAMHLLALMRHGRMSRLGCRDRINALIHAGPSPPRKTLDIQVLLPPAQFPGAAQKLIELFRPESMQTPCRPSQSCPSRCRERLFRNTLLRLMFDYSRHYATLAFALTLMICTGTRQNLHGRCVCLHSRLQLHKRHRYAKQWHLSGICDPILRRQQGLRWISERWRAR